jgi:hypothetical protein
MFRKVNFSSTVIVAAIAAVLFCVPVFFYVRSSSYTSSWLLFMGSFLFFIVMFVNTLHENKTRGEDESTVALVFISLVTTIVGVIFSCLLCFLLMIIMVPGYLNSGMAEKVMANGPANIIHDKTDGLSFEIFMAATAINFSVGSFCGVVLSFYSKRNQTRDNRDPAPLHQTGAK